MRYAFYFLTLVSSIWLCRRDIYLYNDESTNRLLLGSHPFGVIAAGATIFYCLLCLALILIFKPKFSWKYLAIQSAIFAFHFGVVEWLIITEAHV